MMQFISAINLMLIATCGVSAYRPYMLYVPNGDRVPCTVPEMSSADQLDACSGTGICEVFGHERCQAAGEITRFGRAAARTPWKIEFCSADADGDGFSNGDELGDPCCRWRGDTTAPPDRHETRQLSHPDFARSVPRYASCSVSPAGANITLVGIFDGAAAAGDGGATLVLSLPPAVSAASDARCLCAVSAHGAASSIQAAAVFQPPVAADTHTLVAVALPASGLGSAPVVGAPLTVSAQAASLATDVHTMSFTALVQPHTAVPSAAVRSASLQANTAVGGADFEGTFYEINLPVLLAAGVGLVVAVLAVAAVYYCGCVPRSVSAWCVNVRGARRKLQSRGFQVWKGLTAALLLASTAASALLYSEMPFVTMTDAVLGRALGNTALVLLFGAVVSASHHLVLHWAGVSYDRSVFGHMTLGTAAVVVSVVHGVWMALSANIDGARVALDIDSGGHGVAWALGHWTTVASVNPLAGTLSGVFGVFLLFFPGRRCARQHAYAFFYVLHILGAVLMVFFAFLHIANSGLNVAVTLVIPSAVIFAERALLALLHGAALSGRIHAAAPVGGTGSGLFRIIVRQRAIGPAPAPGQWLSMVLPSASLLQHPVSLAGVSRDEADPEHRLLHFVVRAMGDVPVDPAAPWLKRAQRSAMHKVRAAQSWSAKLAAAVEHGTAEGALVLLYDAPLGRHSQPNAAMQKATEHVFFAGGVGVTAVLESAVHQSAQAGRVATLVWALREEALASYGMQLMATLLKGHTRTAKAVPAKHVSDSEQDSGVELTVPASAAVAPDPGVQAEHVVQPPRGTLKLKLYLTANKTVAVAVQPQSAAVAPPSTAPRGDAAGAVTVTAPDASNTAHASDEGSGAAVPDSSGMSASPGTESSGVCGAQTGPVTPESGSGTPSTAAPSQTGSSTANAPPPNSLESDAPADAAAAKCQEGGTSPIAPAAAPAGADGMGDALAQLQDAAEAAGVLLEVAVDRSGQRPVPSKVLEEVTASAAAAAAGKPTDVAAADGATGSDHAAPVCVYVCGPAALSRSVAAAVQQCSAGSVFLHVEQFGW